MNNIQLLNNGFIQEVWSHTYEDEVRDQKLYDALEDFISRNNLISLSYHPHLDDDGIVYDDGELEDVDVENFEFNDDGDLLDTENLTIYKLKDLDIYFSVIGGDWQTPANLVFKYTEKHGILPLLYFQNLHEQKF